MAAQPPPLYTDCPKHTYMVTLFEDNSSAGDVEHWFLGQNALAYDWLYHQR